MLVEETLEKRVTVESQERKQVRSSCASKNVTCGAVSNYIELYSAVLNTNEPSGAVMSHIEPY